MIESRLPRKQPKITMGLGVGVALGAGLGVVFGNIALGAGLGIAFGAALGGLMAWKAR